MPTTITGRADNPPTVRRQATDAGPPVFEQEPGGARRPGSERTPVVVHAPTGGSRTRPRKLFGAISPNTPTNARSILLTRFAQRT
ncbi:hypothetical protein [Actinosynnema sp. NPDC020468]|uniref:hypothetical protein n=1 Tax=Actinosynnema sp. NPDC020468 TaxID=3154488 RepID=UPI003403F4AD